MNCNHLKGVNFVRIEIPYQLYQLYQPYQPYQPLPFTNAKSCLALCKAATEAVLLK